MRRTCFVSIDIEPDFSLSAGKGEAGLPRLRPAGFGGRRQGFKGIENLGSILNIFKSAGVSATFFVTGQVLEKFSEKARQWQQNGFEIACHSFTHTFWTMLSQEQRTAELDKFISLYQNVFGGKPAGFRAPSHLIDNAGIELLQDKGFLYDSSVLPHYPFFKRYRGFQGKAPKKPYFPKSGGYRKKGNMKILEIPVAGHIMGVPLAGAWLSRLPKCFFKTLFFLKKPEFITVSMHPWDAIDFPERTSQPSDFLAGLENVLNILQRHNYQFLTGRQIYEQFSKNI